MGLLSKIILILAESLKLSAKLILSLYSQRVNCLQNKINLYYLELIVKVQKSKVNDKITHTSTLN